MAFHFLSVRGAWEHRAGSNYVRSVASAVIIAGVGLLLGCATEQLRGRDALGDRRDACSTTIAATANTANAAAEGLRVKVTSTREGEVTHLFVENDELCEICMTFEMGLVNLKASFGLPYTVTFPPKQKTEAFALSPMEAGQKWEYTYTNYYKLGSN